jgi:intracellular sulfur oxidation DsrE/DsrF family protein
LTERETQGHQVDAVAHAGGLDMMRADTSLIKEQIVAMMDKLDNVHFVACAGAINMFTQKNGVAPDIIQGMETDYTAFDNIVGRLQGGGWKHIKIESITEIQNLLFRNNPYPAVWIILLLAPSRVVYAHQKAGKQDLLFIITSFGNFHAVQAVPTTPPPLYRSCAGQTVLDDLQAPSPHCYL